LINLGKIDMIFENTPALEGLSKQKGGGGLFCPRPELFFNNSKNKNVIVTKLSDN